MIHRRLLVAALASGAGLGASSAKADFFGGDDVLLAELVTNATQQLIQLQQMFATGQDTLGFLQQVNQGVSEALEIGQTMNRTMSPGTLSDLSSAQAAMSKVQELYGLIPRTPDAERQRTTDQSIAEAINLHNQAYQYASEVDPEAERVKREAHVVSPQGAGRLTAESVGVLIHVMDQVLRTNAAILKVQSEHLALENRKDKLSSEQFLVEYSGLATAFRDLKDDYDLEALSP